MTLAPKLIARTRKSSTATLRKSSGAALLTYHGGPLLANVEVTTIYWGSAWNTWNHDPLRVSLESFFAFIVGSSLIDQLSEYSQPGFTIGHGTHATSVVLEDDPPNPLDDSAIQARLDSLIAAGTVPQPDANSVYFFFLPSGVTVTLQGQASCQQFCGYHNLSASGVVYAVDTYDDCPGCQFVPGDLLASSTVVASHELCEAITDPQLNAWFDDSTGEEIADICEGSNKVINAPTGNRLLVGIVRGHQSGKLLEIAATQSEEVQNPTGTTYTLSGNATAMADGTIQGNIVLTPPNTAPPPPPPPPTGQSWTVQTEWTNAQQACV